MIRNRRYYQSKVKRLQFFVTLELVLLMICLGFVLHAQTQVKRVSELEEKVSSLEIMNLELTDFKNSSEDEINSLLDEVEGYKEENSSLTNQLTDLTKEIEERNEYDAYVIDILSRLVYSEAGNQSEEGKYAVAWVVRNRVESGQFPDTWEEVIFQESQFCGTKTDNFSGEIPQSCVDVATEVYHNSDKYRIPENVLYFKTVTCKADWDFEEWDTIDDHIFYYGD